MKRIYVSFFVTITIALSMTLIAFLNRDKKDTVVIMEHNKLSSYDSTFLEFTVAGNLFN